MIVLNDHFEELKKKLTTNNFYVVSDFDRTLTIGDSITSWAILSSSNYVDKNYNNERNAYYDYYRPIELDPTVPFEKKNKLMKEWFKKHMQLFSKYQLSEEVIIEAAKNQQVMHFREGASEFLKYLADNNIPLIIISAGIGNFIEQFLKQQNCYFDNIYIVTNFIKFKNGVACDIDENIIHSLNKNEVSYNDVIKESIKDKDYVILFGDQVEDSKMVSEDKRSQTIRVGFLDKNISENKKIFEDTFDVIGIDNTSYYEIIELLDLK